MYVFLDVKFKFQKTFSKLFRELKKLTNFFISIIFYEWAWLDNYFFENIVFFYLF